MRPLQGDWLVIPAKFARLKPGHVARLVYGTLAVFLVGGVGWLFVRDWLDGRERELQNRAQERATARDAEVIAMLARVDVGRTREGGLGSCKAIDERLPVIESVWHAWLIGGQNYETRPNKMSEDSEAFQYLAREWLPSSADGWRKRERIVLDLLKAPRVGVLGENGSLVVYKTNDGLAECVASSVDAINLRSKLWIKARGDLLFARGRHTAL